MENDDLIRAFRGAGINVGPKGSLGQVKVDLSQIVPVEQAPQKASRGGFRATLRGSLTVLKPEKLVKALNNFEKKTAMPVNKKFDGQNKNIDQAMYKWLGEVEIESLPKGVSIVLDNEFEVPVLFSPFLANLASEATGTLQMIGEDKVVTVYDMKDGRLSIREVLK